MPTDAATWQTAVQELRDAALEDEAGRLEARWRAALAAPLRAPVLGGMKAGKSSLLNHLLELPTEARLPIDVLQATAKIVRLIPFDETAFLLLDDREAEALPQVVESREDWAAWVRGEAMPPAHRTLGLGVDSEWLEDLGLELVDTPGINSPTEGLFDVTWAAVPGGPLALYAMPAQALCQASDMDFIQSVRQHAGAFVFLLTKIDQMGAQSYQDAAINELVEILVANLAELGVEPLAICPVSTEIPDPVAGGWVQLRKTLRQAATSRRAEIVQSALARHDTRALTTEATRHASEVDILRQRLSLDRESFRSKLGELEAQKIEEQETLATGERRLARKLDTVRIQTLKEMGRLGESAFQHIARDLEGLETVEQIDHYVQIELRAQVDAWRGDLIRSTRNAFDQLDDLGAEAVAEVAEAYAQRLRQVFSAEITLAPPPQQVRHDTGTHDPEIDAIETQRAGLAAELERLRSEAAGDPSLFDIQRALVENDQQIASTRYQPIYHTILEDDGAETFRNLGRLAGKVGDIATLTSPIPTTELNALRSLKKGSRVIKGIRRFNYLVNRKNRFLRRSSRMSRWLDKLSFEHWGEQVGGWVGQVLRPDKERKVEDPEAREAHDERIRFLREQSQGLRRQLVEAEGRERTNQEAIETLLRDDQALRHEIRRLRRTGDASSRQRAAQLQELQLFEWKTNVLEEVRDQLMKRAGEGWYARARRGFEQIFDEVRHQAVARFTDDCTRTLRGMEENLKRIEKSYDQDRQEVQGLLEESELRRTAFTRAAEILGTTIP